MVDIIADAEKLATLTADVAAQNPTLVKDLESYYEGKKREFEEWAKAQFGGKPEVQATPQVSQTKSQEDVIAEMQSTIAALQRQLNSAKAGTSEPVVMEGGEPVTHTLFLDNGQVVTNHAGLATHYSVTVPASATEDEHEEIHKVVAAYPA